MMQIGTLMPHPSDTPEGTTRDTYLDLAVWDADNQEWLLHDSVITNWDDGLTRLQNKRKHWRGPNPQHDVRLVRVVRTIEINDLGE